jgi:hypothetical protein
MYRFIVISLVIFIAIVMVEVAIVYLFLTQADFRKTVIRRKCRNFVTTFLFFVTFVVSVRAEDNADVHGGGLAYQVVNGNIYSGLDSNSYYAQNQFGNFTQAVVTSTSEPYLAVTATFPINASAWQYDTYYPASAFSVTSVDVEFFFYELNESVTKSFTGSYASWSGGILSFNGSFSIPDFDDPGFFCNGK